MSKKEKLMYCANGDEGIEFASESKKECEDWIYGTQLDNEMPTDYYNLEVMTKAEYEALPEV